MTSAASSSESLLRRALEELRLGQLERAHSHLLQAAEVNPSHVGVWYLMGVLLSESGRHVEALDALGRAMTLRPDFVDAQVCRAATLARAGSPDEALAQLERAMALGADGAHLHVMRAAVLIDLRRPSEAIESCRRALRRDPNFPEAQVNLGARLYLNANYEAAAEACRAAARISPASASAHAYLGCALLELQRLEEALLSLTRAVELDPGHSIAHNARALCLMDLGRETEALASCQRAIEAQPRRHEAYNTRGMLQDDSELAIADFDRAIELAPDAAEPRFNKGTRLLRRGEFRQGWELYEFRPMPGGHFQGLDPARLWNGTEDIAGRNFFTYAEQGLGDTIHFCRYAKLLTSRGARVVLAVHPSLVSLLRGLDPNVAVIGYGEDVPEFDRHCPLLSLPRAFGTSKSTIPADVPYLIPHPNEIARWRDRLGEPVGMRIGIAWQGSTGRVDRGRSFALRELAPIATLEDVELLSLQKGAGSEQLDLAREWLVKALGADLQSFLDTAAVIRLADLIITSDTSIAHLAGALGRPVWVALKYLPEWRWMLGRDDSPWYPTMRLFRQPRPGDWGSVFAGMRAALQ